MQPEMLALLGKTINMMEGFAFLWVVQTGLELNLWEEFSQEKTLNEILELHPDWDHVLVDHWLEQAYCLDLLNKREVYYSTTKLGKAVQSYRSFGLEDMYKELALYWTECFTALPKLIARKLDKFQLNQELENELISRASIASEPFVWPLLREKFRANHFKRVIDIGCGEGYYLSQLLDCFPQLEGLGVEINPEVASRARERAKAFGKRLDIRCTDALELDTSVGNFDICLLNNIIYYFNREQRRKLLGNVNRILNSGGQIGILTALRGSDYTHRLFRTHIPQNLMSFFLACHQGFQGLPKTEDITVLLKESGFTDVVTRPVMFNTSYYFFATKP